MSGIERHLLVVYPSRVCLSSSFMLCSSCQNQPSCLPAKLAETDHTLAEMLDHLQDCNLRSNDSRLPLLRKLTGIFQSLWSGLRQGIATLTGRLWCR